jgi:hypothetical protein
MAHYCELGQKAFCPHLQAYMCDCRVSLHCTRELRAHYLVHQLDSKTKLVSTLGITLLSMSSMKYVPAVVLYLRRFINDGLGVWLHDPDLVADKSNWKEFQDCLNTSGLKWLFSKKSQEVVCMDLRLKIVDRRITTSLYAKPISLCLYLPPHYCHAPGVL